jgi:hypothetical protein
MNKIFLTFILVLVHGARQLTQASPLEEKMGKSPSNDNTKDNYLIQKELLENLGLMDDCSFVSFWYFYENKRPVSTIEFIREIMKPEGERRIFRIMRRGFKKFMRKKLLIEFVGPLSKESKEELLFQAISLYQGRMRSIWERIGEPGTKKFDNWPFIFFFFQKTIHLGIYDTLEGLFNEIMLRIDGYQTTKYLYRLKKQFWMLAVFLLNCEKEQYGLPWMAAHPDPRLILSLFLYNEDITPSKSNYFYFKIKDKDADRL